NESACHSIAAYDLHGDSRVASNLAFDSSITRNTVSLAVANAYISDLSHPPRNGDSLLDAFGKRKKAAAGNDRSGHNRYFDRVLAWSYYPRSQMANATTV